MGEINYLSCYVDSPEVIAQCINCRRETCYGMCIDYKNAVRKMMGLEPLDVESAHDYPPIGRKHYANGEWHTITEWAQIVGINRETLYHRVQRGMSMAEAINRPGRDYRRRLTVNGVEMTVNQWAERMGVSVGTIYRRLRSGCTPAEAVMGRPSGI